MKKLILLLAALGCVMTAKAIPITGSISFSGSVQFDTGDPSTANAITAWSNTQVDAADGAFGLFLASGAPVTFTAPYVFNPSTALTPLWTAGGFTFDLASSTIDAQFSLGPLQFLSISGTGTVSGNGYTATLGDWSFTAQSPSSGGSFRFAASVDTHGLPVPDLGNTLVLLSLAMGGIDLVRRKMVA